MEAFFYVRCICFDGGAGDWCQHWGKTMDSLERPAKAAVYRSSPVFNNLSDEKNITGLRMLIPGIASISTKKQIRFFGSGW